MLYKNFTFIIVIIMIITGIHKVLRLADGRKNFA